MWNETPRCRFCHRIISFVKTPKGKWMPVDSFSQRIIPREGGTLYYKENGEPVRGDLTSFDMIEGTVQAYIPHYYGCTGATTQNPPKKKIDEAEAKRAATRAAAKAASEKQAEEIRKKREYEAYCRELASRQTRLFDTSENIRR